MFDSVSLFLESQVRSRPQTLKEIYLNVDKSRTNCWLELNTLLLYGTVSVITIYFNGLRCSFYTMRSGVNVTFVKVVDARRPNNL